MPRRHHPAISEHRLDTLLGRIGRHMPYRHEFLCEWPYIAGSTCLVVLLVWQPFQPPALALVFHPQADSAEHFVQPSLSEIDASCYQVNSEALADLRCHGDCAEDQAASVPAENPSEFSRSLLTCVDMQRDPLRNSSGYGPQNMTIEVIKSNHSF
ncbi:hypothetical protein ACJRW5_23595 [Pseudomonas sp. SH1-B]